MDGSTSDVTHLRNAFASGLRDWNINVYKPDSLTTLVIRCLFNASVS